MRQNPFPGPQPYRAAERARFFGRDAAARNLANQVLARPATTVYGPSGAGKSSLMQAGVIPALEDSDGIRVVRLDAWPAGEAPLPWLVDAIVGGLELGASPETRDALAALAEAMDRAARRSDRPILIYLDQLEQLFVSERSEEEMAALLEGLHWLIQAPHKDLHLVLSIREDYLGRVRDWTREREELSAHGFRVAPLSVGEMVKTMCRTAAEGEPAQRWDAGEIRDLMLSVREAGQRAVDTAEVQTAFGQIVCRALWEERFALSEALAAGVPMKKREARGADAEAILRRYLDATVEGLGGFQEAARKLLEEHLIDHEGHRRLLTEKEARLWLPGEQAAEVLGRLERAAVLRAEEHQGSRYFELGHDWLARKVFERRLEREKEEAEEGRREQEERRREKDAERLATERAARRRLGAIAAVAIVVAVVMGVLVIWALRQSDAAQTALLMASARELMMGGKGVAASKVLLQVKHPDDVRGWKSLAEQLLERSIPKTSLRHSYGVASAAWSPDGKRILTRPYDKKVWVWNAEGAGDPIVLRHDEVVSSAAWSPDGNRIATASLDKTARVWNADGAGDPIVLRHEQMVNSAAWSPDGKRIVTASHDPVARVWSADSPRVAVELRGHEEEVTSAAWSPDGTRIVTTSRDKTARVWNADGTVVAELRGHALAVSSAAWSPDGKRIVTGSADRTARVWSADGSAPAVELPGHREVVTSVAWSPDGKRIVTISSDVTLGAHDVRRKVKRDDEARVWSADGKGDPIVLEGWNEAYGSAVWSPDSRRVATASSDNTVRIWSLDGSGSHTVLEGHENAVRSAAWSPDGARIVTTSEDRTARVWNVAPDPIRLRHPNRAVSAAFSPNGRRIVTAYKDGPARVWNADGSGDPLALQGEDDSLRWSSEFAAWSPDGTRVVSRYQLSLRVWNVDVAGNSVVLRNHIGIPRSATWSPDSTRVLFKEIDGAWIWSVDGKGAPVALEHAPLEAAVWSPDGKRVVTTSLDSTARIWNADGSGEPIPLKGHRSSVPCAAWSPSGKRIVTGSHDDTARIWNADGSGTPIVLAGHAGSILSASWSPNGKRIVTASNDRTARIWNVDGPGDPIVLKSDAAFTSAAWSPDGKRVLTKHDNHTALLWDPDDSVFPLALGSAVSAEWSPDGQRIAIVKEDGDAYVLFPARRAIVSIRQALRDANNDCLSPELRQTYLNESGSDARSGYEACERVHRRTPFFAEALKP